MKKLLPWVSLSTLAIVASACGSNVANNSPAPFIPPSAPTSGPTPPTTATVAFKVTVPQAASIVTSGVKRPNLTAPVNSTMVSFNVTTVNGAAYTGTPSKFNLTGSNCTTSTSGTTCTFNVSVPAADDVIQIRTFDSTGSVTGEGNVEVQASNGGTISEPTTLGGAVSKITVSAFGEEGVAGTYPVVVTAYDINGKAIIGTYSAPITLADSDTSGATSLSATNVPDSMTGASITVKYTGAAMTPATISATASGIAASGITNATFPDETYPTVSSSSSPVPIEIDESNSGGYYDATPGPLRSPYPYSGIGSKITTGQSLTVNGATVNNLVEQSTTGIVGRLPGTSTYAEPLYYAWTPQGQSLSYGYVGYDYVDSASNSTELCTAPYSKLVVLPTPSASWDALAGSGPCTYTYAYNSSGNTATETATLKSDGSYVDSGNYNAPASGTYSGDSGNYKYTTNADGSATIYSNDTNGSAIITLSIPQPNASTVPVTLQTFPGPIPSPGSTTTPAPVATTAPNPWPLISLMASPGPTGPQQPLMTDNFTPKGTLTLPTQCNIPSSFVGTNPTVSEVDEQLTITDPTGDIYPNWVSIAYKHYYFNGVGEVCTKEEYEDWYFAGYPGVVQWYTGAGQHYYTDHYLKYSYITNTTVSVLAKTRSFAQAMPSAAQALTSMNISLRQQQLGLHHLQMQMAREQHTTIQAIRREMNQR